MTNTTTPRAAFVAAMEQARAEGHDYATAAEWGKRAQDRVVRELTDETLIVRERESGWKPAHLREQLDELDLTPEAVAVIEATADELEADHKVYAAELERRRQEAPTQPWTYRV